MRISDLIHGKLSTIDLERRDGESFPNDLAPKSEVTLVVGEDHVLRLSVDERGWEVQGCRAADAEQLENIMRSGLPRLAWLVQGRVGNQPVKRVLVQVHEFVAAIHWSEALDLGVDERLVDDMRKRRQRQDSVETVVGWLSQQLLLNPRASGEPVRVILSGSPDISSERKTAFRLYGRGHAIDIERSTDDRLLVKRVTQTRRAVEGEEHFPLYLVTGAIRFCDSTVAGRFRGAARTELDVLVHQSASYLKLWHSYNEIEQEAIRRRAKEFGSLRYSKAKMLPDGSWNLSLELGKDPGEAWSRLDALDGRQELQTGTELPPILLGKEDQPAKRDKAFTGKVVGKHRHAPSVILRPLDEREELRPPAKGLLFVAIGGDETRLRRRSRAWEQIRGCTNPMPQLGMMLEGKFGPTRARRELRALTTATQQRLPEPNDAQHRALEIALNTPDIALVQGPPGTGKTRVIAALQARLAEPDEGASPDGLAGNTLLTSFQHDAVENAASATVVMGLPAIKIGGRRGSDSTGDGVERWTQQTAQDVRAARATVDTPDSVHRAQKQVRAIAIAYLSAPSRADEPSSVLAEISELASPWLSAELVAELAGEAGQLAVLGPAQLAEEDRSFALGSVRSLRTEAIPFGDDGPANARKVLRRIRRLEGFELDPSQESCLERAASWNPDEDAPAELLTQLRELRDLLIDRLQPRVDELTVPQAHADTERLIARVLDELDERARERAPGVELAIDEWLETLERDPDGCRAAIAHYSMVLAATCQQSVSRKMVDAKGGSGTVFRTVVVDEAARANPLDLLIPMAQAERRIVLVGDHRQLPHILEPDVERELARSIEAQTEAALKRSLFERLFSLLREQQERDGIQRVVTLNVQYRMHPKLGAFVSEQFYEPYGEQFSSGCDATEFAHNIKLAGGVSLANKIAAWIELPHERGGESSERSKRRVVEARCIAREVAAIVAEHPSLSVGVIAFYAAQRDEVFVAMEDHGLSERDESGAYRVRERWRNTSEGRERLRVGTVDAFQGKEFDVVFLSLTRSNRVNPRDEASRRRRYGFLLLENRLCVAMSRQQRLLIVVGDPAMVAGSEGASSLRALHAFRQLCEGDDGAIIRR